LKKFWRKVETEEKGTSTKTGYIEELVADFDT
jgi:hypothetical protein